MVETLGRMKGAAMKIGQLASFIDTEFLPPEYRELYQDKLAKLRTTGAADALEEGALRARRGVGRAARGAVRGLRARGRGRGVDRPGAPGRAPGRPRGGGEDPVPRRGGGHPRGHAERRDDHAAWRRRWRRDSTRRPPRRELKERVLEELDYEFEAQNQRSFARGYRGHPSSTCRTWSRACRRGRVLVSEWVDGMGFEEVPRAAAGGARPLRGDRLPLLLRLDLPPAALQRRRPPGQLLCRWPTGAWPSSTSA